MTRSGKKPKGKKGKGNGTDDGKSLKIGTAPSEGQWNGGNWTAGGRASKRTPKLSEQIARRIVDEIFDQGIPPGGTLPPERVMLDSFGVSRGTLREALRVLEVHGLIAIKPGPNGGPVVRSMTANDFGRSSTLHFQGAGATFRELWEARLALEPVTARMAAELDSSQVKDELRRLIDLSTGISIHDAPNYLAASSDFHSVFAGMCGNRILDLYAIALKEVWTARVTELLFPPSQREKVQEDHTRIANAIIAGDGPQAEALMRAHMHEMLRYVIKGYPDMLEEVVSYNV